MNKKKVTSKCKKWFRKKKPSLKKKSSANTRTKIKKFNDLPTLQENQNKVLKNPFESNLENRNKMMKNQNDEIKIQFQVVKNPSKPLKKLRSTKKYCKDVKNQSHSSDIIIVDNDFPSWFK